MITEQKKAPVQTLRDGAMFVKLWEQQGSKGPYVTATTGRTFKNEQTGEYGEAKSFSRNDLLKLGTLLTEAGQEMRKWEEYYRTQAQEQTQEQAQAPQVRQDVQPQPKGLAVERDAALANAVPLATQQAPRREPER